MKSLNCIRVSKPCGTGKDSSALTGWTNGDGGGHGRISTGCGENERRQKGEEGGQDSRNGLVVEEEKGSEAKGWVGSQGGKEKITSAL